MDDSTPCKTLSDEPTAEAKAVMSDIAQQILEIGEKVWADVEAKYGPITHLYHKEIERRIDAMLKDKFPETKWHPNFAGMIGGYTETFVIRATRNVKPARDAGVQPGGDSGGDAS